MKLPTLDDVDVKGKTVILRVDLNVPYDLNAHGIRDSERIRAHAETVKELSDKGAKVIVLAHQGRKGDLDFTHLAQHAELLARDAGKDVLYVDDVIGEEALKAIAHYGDLLENAGTIVVKGPAGAYEEEGFEFGTRALLDEVKNSSAYTLIGGGHTSAALASLGFSRDDFSYVSVAGGALITYLSGKDLPGVKALQNAVSIKS